LITERDVRIAELDARDAYWDMWDTFFLNQKMFIRDLKGQGRVLSAEAMEEALQGLRLELRRDPHFKETKL
jgi:hypothetical protein